MWRRWLKTMRRLRLSTLMLLIIILGMAVALVHQQQREARLQSALRSARNANEEAIRVALDQPFDATLVKATAPGGLIGIVALDQPFDATLVTATAPGGLIGIVALDQPFDAKRIPGPTLALLLREIKRVTRNGVLPDGIPIYVDPIGLQEAGVTMNSPVTVSSKDVPIRKALADALGQLKLCYVVKDGWMLITSKESPL
jgi:hypothetical protein